jgi:hypothetical protein
MKEAALKLWTERGWEPMYPKTVTSSVYHTDGRTLAELIGSGLGGSGNLLNGSGENSVQLNSAVQDFVLSNPEAPKHNSTFLNRVVGGSSILLSACGYVSVPYAIVGGLGNVYEAAVEGRGIIGGRYNYSNANDVLGCGTQNSIESNRVVFFGNLNKVGTNCSDSIIGGQQNDITINSMNCAVFGLGNKITRAHNSLLSGRNLINSGVDNLTIFGVFNDDYNYDKLFVVGCGQEPTAANGWRTVRENALEVLTNGVVIANKAPGSCRHGVIRKVEYDLLDARITALENKVK